MNFILDSDLIINPDILLHIFITLSSLYFILLILINIGLLRLKVSQANLDYSVSIVIAARNEENRIQLCLQSLEKIDYPAEKYEIILVDDNSDDQTADIIEKFVHKYQNWNLIRLDRKRNDLRGKKNALLNGIAAAKGELIFTTDADCIVPPGWIKNMVSYFKPGISMVLGYSPLLPAFGFHFKFLQFDNLFSAVVAAAPTKLGYPFASVGRNLAYRKDAYEDVGGFLSLKKFRSGDDIHLTTRFHYTNNGKIDFCADPDTFISTHLPKTGRELINQQIRKNSKTFQLSGSSILLMLVVFTYFILTILLPFLIPDQIYLWLGLILAKFFGEFYVLRKAAGIFKQKKIVPFIPLMQVIYPAHIILFSIIGIFQFYEWKK